MPTEQKRETVEEIKERFSGAAAVIMADYRGLSVKEMQELRRKLRASGGDVKIYKNTLTEIALRELALSEDLVRYLDGPTAFVFSQADAVAPSKAIVDFAKEHKALEVKGGLVENAVVGPDAVRSIAALPSREELIAKLLGTMQNPVARMMRVMNGPAAAFARAVAAVAGQKAAV
ncbi:MAG: 50S ribosomal protein L10 [Coriobacteriia bacterium]|nr:50S ribosomal protein L10 [Coriobacteriia bacterium]